MGFLSSKFLSSKFRWLYTTKAMSQFSPDILTEFKEECSANTLQINESKTKILKFNPLKGDLVCPNPWSPLVLPALVLGVDISVDCSFSAHIRGLVQKGNCALSSLILMCRLGFPVDQLKTPYLTYKCHILEYTCPVLGPQIHNIEYLSGWFGRSSKTSGHPWRKIRRL